MHEGLRHEQLTRFAVQRVGKPIAIKVNEGLSRFSLDLEIDKDILIYPVIVPRIVRGFLVGPLRFSGIGIPSENRHRPLVITRTLVGIPGPWVPSAIIKKIECGVVGVPAPSCASPF